MMDQDSSYLYLLRAVERGVDSGAFATRPGYGVQEIVYHAWALVHGIATLRTTVFRSMPADMDETDERVLCAFVRGLQLP
jgi:hypothetical protein